MKIQISAEIEVLCGRAARLAYMSPFELSQCIEDLEDGQGIMVQNCFSVFSRQARSHTPLKFHPAPIFPESSRCVTSIF